MSAQPEKSRAVGERVFIRGQLVLETPASFGSGDKEGSTDMSLLYDSVERQRPLLTGASIAGALRSYLWEAKRGYGWQENPKATWKNKSLAEKLFGHLDDSNPDLKGSEQSWLAIDDALGTLPQTGEPVEFRDGVAIDPKTGTAEEKKKFDIELLAAGTIFDLHFELWLPDQDEMLLPALAHALYGLETGQIGLGRRKRRGYGQCKVTGWSVSRYPMNRIEGVIGWLSEAVDQQVTYQPDICDLLGAPKPETHAGISFHLTATFILPDSLLIRSEGVGDNPVDMVHLRSWRKGKDQPILSGTSLAGAIRSRARRIAITVKGEDTGRLLINQMFGKRIRNTNDEPSGSRVLIAETEVKNPIDHLVHSRVKIDRFTSGAYPQALFSQQPIFGSANGTTKLAIQLELRQWADESDTFKAQVGLLLLVLKDLWTGDLPLGGERSVGRGRLQGESALLSLPDRQWELTQSSDGKIEIAGKGTATELESYVTAFHAWQPAKRKGSDEN